MSVKSMSNLRRACFAGLIAGAVGIVILNVSGVEMPVVPPGLVLLVVAAVLVAAVRGRWVTGFATLVALAEIAGFFVSGSAEGLLDFGSIGIFAGTWTRLIGVVVASVAGTMATFNRVESPSPHTTRDGLA
jgi:hypothetical protein